MECTEQSWKREGQTTGEDWCLRGRARGRSLHRPAVSLTPSTAKRFRSRYIMSPPPPDPPLMMATLMAKGYRATLLDLQRVDFR